MNLKILRVLVFPNLMKLLTHLEKLELVFDALLSEKNHKDNQMRKLCVELNAHLINLSNSIRELVYLIEHEQVEDLSLLEKNDELQTTQRR